MKNLLFALALAVIVFLLVTKASADDQPRLPSGYSCSDVITNVRKYGYWPALLWARANGFSEAEIAAAKRCLRK